MLLPIDAQDAGWPIQAVCGAIGESLARRKGAKAFASGRNKSPL